MRAIFWSLSGLFWLQDSTLECMQPNRCYSPIDVSQQNQRFGSGKDELFNESTGKDKIATEGHEVSSGKSSSAPGVS